MIKPEFEVMFFGEDVITSSGCGSVCTGECGSHTCNAECESFCGEECTGQGIY